MYEVMCLDPGDIAEIRGAVRCTSGYYLMAQMDPESIVYWPVCAVPSTPANEHAVMSLIRNRVEPRPGEVWRSLGPIRVVPYLLWRGRHAVNERIKDNMRHLSLESHGWIEYLLGVTQDSVILFDERGQALPQSAIISRSDEQYLSIRRTYQAKFAKFIAHLANDPKTLPTKSHGHASEVMQSRGSRVGGWLKTPHALHLDLERYSTRARSHGWSSYTHAEHIECYYKELTRLERVTCQNVIVKEYLPGPGGEYPEWAIVLCGQLKILSAVPLLVELVTDSEKRRDLGREVVEALVRIGGSEAYDHLRSLWNRVPVEMSSHVLGALIRLDWDASIPLLSEIARGILPSDMSPGERIKLLSYAFLLRKTCVGFQAATRDVAIAVNPQDDYMRETLRSALLRAWHRSHAQIWRWPDGMVDEWSSCDLESFQSPVESVI